MVHEPRGTTHVHPIADVFCVNGVVFVLELVEIHQVVVFICAFFPLVGFLGRDDLPPIGVHELSFEQILVAAQTPSALRRLEDIEADFAAPLDDAILAVGAAVAARVAFEDVPPGLQDLFHQAAFALRAVGVLASFYEAFAVGVSQAAAFVWVFTLVGSPLSAAVTADHHILGRSADTLAKLALLDKAEAGWWRAVIDGVS